MAVSLRLFLTGSVAKHPKDRPGGWSRPRRQRRSDEAEAIRDRGGRRDRARPQHLVGPGQRRSPDNAVTAWNQVAVTTLIGLPGPAGGAPPAAQVTRGHGAGSGVRRRQRDRAPPLPAVPADQALLRACLEGRRRRGCGVRRAPQHRRHRAGTSCSGGDRTGLLESLATQYASALAAIPDGPFKTQGLAAGKAAAAAMIAARRDDGRFGPSQWVPNTAPGHWWPQLNAARATDPRPDTVGRRRGPLRHAESSSQFRTAGPNSLSSAAWATEFNEVKAIGALNSAVRTTPRQTYIARWWQSTPVASWNEVARELAARDGLDVADTARLLAMQNLERRRRGDQLLERQVPLGLLAAVERDPPGSGGRQPGDGAGRRLDAADLGAVPRAPVRPPLPRRRTHRASCRCSSATRSRAASRSPASRRFSAPTDPRTRTFGSFSQALAEIIEARIWAGLHYRTADVQGEGARQECRRLHDGPLLPAGRPRRRATTGR